MRDFTKLLTASEELLDDSNPEEPADDLNSRKVLLAKKLEAQGKKPICVGRALVTVERCESAAELPKPIASGWGVLKISVYSDPDVSGNEKPDVLYIDGGRYGLSKLIYENENMLKVINVFS